MLLDDCFSGNYGAEEILDKLESVDTVGQREQIVRYNLGLLDEYNDKVICGFDVEESRRVFNARFKLLLEYVPESRKLYFSNLLLDYVNGKKSADQVVDKYGFFIYE